MDKKILVFLIFFFALTINVKVDALDIQSDDVLKEEAINFYKNTNFSSSLDYLQHINKKDRDVYLLIANCYESLGQIDKAKETLKFLTVEYPSYSSGHYNLAVLFYKNKDYKMAVYYFNNVLKYQKNFIPAYYNIGNAYFELGEYKKAIKHYKRAINLDKNIKYAYFNISLCYQRLNDTKNADKYSKLYSD